MTNQKTIIAHNIKRLIAHNQMSISQYARKAQLAPATLTTFLKYPEERNISIGNLESLCEVGKIELWNIFIKDFPLQTAKKEQLRKISAEGYLILQVFEESPDMVKYSIMDAVAQSTQKTNKKKSEKIREKQNDYIK